MATPSLQPYTEKNKPYRFAVYYDGTDGSRKRSKFETRKAAVEFFTDKEVEYENLGKAVAAGVDNDLKRDAHSAHQLLKEFGATLEDAAAYFRKHLLATSKSAPVAELVQAFLDQKRQNGRSERHLGDLKNRLDRFTEKFGTRYPTEIGSPEVEDWLMGLAKISKATRNHYRAKVHAFFSWCVRKGRCMTNPVTVIEKAEESPTTCEIYTPAEMRLLLHTATTWKPGRIKPLGKRKRRNCRQLIHYTDDVLANLVLCGFAGLRQSEFERLTWEMVKLDRSKIDLPPEITKTKRRKLVTIPPVLAVWLLKHFPTRKGPVMRKQNFSNRMKAFKHHVRDAHGLAWRHNGLRHSFASYLLEQTQNPGHVAVELGHRGNVGVLWDHYAERVSKEDAETYWKLTPDVVAGDVAGVVQFEAKAATA